MISKARKNASRFCDDNVARKLSSVLEPSLGRVDACAIMKYLLGGRDAVNLRLWRRSYSSILFNLPRYREMHSIAISPGVEDSAHLRTLSSSPISIPFSSPSLLLSAPTAPLQRSLSRSSESPEEGVGAGRELHPADNTSWTDNEPARLSSYVQPQPPVSILSPPRPRRALLCLFLERRANPLRELPAEISVTNL